MSDIRETAIEHVAGEETATFYSAEKKWINLIYRLKEQYPDEVDIRYVNKDGSLVVHIPASWVKVKPKKKVAMTTEQIEASKARLEQGRIKRLQQIGDDDAHVVSRKDQDEDGEQKVQ